MEKKGISVILCCHNSKKYIVETLEHLSVQRISFDLKVEIILVDNASTDDTKELAITEWKKLNSKLPFKALSEPRAGLIHARKRGISEAQYSYLIFCDDDNFLSDNYLQAAYNIMESNSQIGALGGYGYPIFEKSPKPWFDQLGVNYATGKQASENGKVPINISYVYGAGSIYRKAALDFLYENGFKSYLIGRKGKKLLASEDVELGYALTLAGFKIWFDDTLRFGHIIPERRVSWSYVKQDAFGHGYSRAFLRPYQNILLRRAKYNPFLEFFHLAKAALSLLRIIIKRDYRKKSAIKNIMMNGGELTSYISNFKKIRKLRLELKSASWIQRTS